MTLPKEIPIPFRWPLEDYKTGKIGGDELRRGIADAIKAEPSLQAFKDEYLAWTDYAEDGGEFLSAY
ncbi:hypothetical protein [Manganibacter manganicus]|uniref:Uncharacterized protein n=1 Tax=Manganibacter manganicus TaxID=1873176 RepID=A0A1V8RNB5_9HYPH|nr:hypothetical protein [Pseudaminobacter manganicus]OQM74702.1 hypothetical protein BFN67_03435 [Pseudaminobacter manganicus]